MSLKVNADFQGVEFYRTRVGATIQDAPLDAIAGDDGNTYEALSGKNADGTGGAASHVDVHVHDSGNTRMWWPIFTHCWGSPRQRDVGEGVGPLIIRTTSGTSSKGADDPLVWGVPFYVAPAWVDHLLKFILVAESDTSDSIGLDLDVTDDTLTTVVRQNIVPVGIPAGAGFNLAGGQTHSCAFSVPSSGWYVAIIKLTDDDLTND